MKTVIHATNDAQMRAMSTLRVSQSGEVPAPAAPAVQQTRRDYEWKDRGLAGLGRLREAAFVDPADPGAGFHDDGPAFVAREPEAVEHACVARGRAAGLLDPAMQIIGGASGVLDAKTPRHGPRKAAGTILAVG